MEASLLTLLEGLVVFRGFCIVEDHFVSFMFAFKSLCREMLATVIIQLCSSGRFFIFFLRET